MSLPYCVKINASDLDLVICRQYLLVDQSLFHRGEPFSLAYILNEVRKFNWLWLQFELYSNVMWSFYINFPELHFTNYLASYPLTCHLIPHHHLPSCDVLLSIPSRLHKMGPLQCALSCITLIKTSPHIVKQSSALKWWRNPSCFEVSKTVQGWWFRRGPLHRLDLVSLFSHEHSVCLWQMPGRMTVQLKIPSH